MVRCSIVTDAARVALACLLWGCGLSGCGGARAPEAAQSPEPAAEAAPGYGFGEAPAKGGATPQDEDRVTSSGGDATEESQQYARPPRPEPTTAEQASAQLDEDERALLTAIDDAKKAMELAGGPDGAGACPRVCAALGSMRRSAAAVCRLAGDDDERCDRARGILARSEDRVRDAGCGCEAP